MGIKSYNIKLQDTYLSPRNSEAAASNLKGHPPWLSLKRHVSQSCSLHCASGKQGKQKRRISIQQSAFESLFNRVARNPIK
ncbi:unnamed protein product [Musa acuminata var. zebrina]